MNQKELEERLIRFASDVSKFLETLPNTSWFQNLKGQLSRSSSSSALNYGEARGAESKKDFVHKIKIVLKELRESLNALHLISKSNYFTNGDDLQILLREANELVSIYVASVKTGEKNLMNQ